MIDGYYYNNLEMEFSMTQSLHTWQTQETMALRANCIGVSFIGNQPSEYRQIENTCKLFMT